MRWSMLVAFAGLLWTRGLGQAGPAGDGCTALLVEAADSDPEPAIAQTVTELSSALRSHGFCLAASADRAHAAIEIVARRQVRIARSKTVNAPLVVDLIRMQMTRGDDIAEVRAYGQVRYQATGEAVRSAAVEVQRWLEAHPAPPKPAPKPEDVPAGPLETLLSRADRYVRAYEQQFASIIGEERYRQAFHEVRILDGNVSPKVTTTSRTLRSEVSFAWFPDARGWFGFRDVIDVDGKPVRDRDSRLAALFLEKRDAKVLARALQESSRYNIGTIRRNFNVPMLALQFLERTSSSRFRFEEAEPEHVGGVLARVLRYRETARPSLITADGADAPARGRFWLEPDSGAVIETELTIGNRRGDIRIRTWYGPDARLGIRVPVRMMETYDYSERLYDYIECEAAYTSFRRFETGARIVK